MSVNYAFIKDGVLENVLVYSTKDDEAAEALRAELNFDEAIFINSDQPTLGSTYLDGVFTPPESILPSHPSE